MLFQRIEQLTSKTKIACHKFAVILGTIHSCKVEHEISLGAELVQQGLVRVDIKLKYLVDLDVRTGTVLAVTDIF